MARAYPSRQASPCRSPRRAFLERAAFAGLALALPASAVPAPSPVVEVVDTHVHFYDPTRPQGVPWPEKNSPLYRPVLPPHYRQLPQPLPVSGVIVVEASPWLEDNQWILDLAKSEPLILGLVGNLDPAQEAFAGHLERLAKNPLFRGFRLRTPKQIQAGLAQPGFMSGLKKLAALGLALDAGGGGSPLEEVARLAGAIPDLRIIINHLAGVRVDGQAPKPEWIAALRNAARGQNVFCKVSGLVEGTGRRDGTAPNDLDFYRPVLNAAWEVFGEDRLIYGSNWPVSELFAPCATVQRLIREYFQEKGRVALEKVCRLNAQKAYHWHKVSAP